MTEPNTQPDPRNAELSALTHALGLSHARVAELEALREELSALRKQLEEVTRERDEARTQLSATRERLTDEITRANLATGTNDTYGHIMRLVLKDLGMTEGYVREISEKPIPYGKEIRLRVMVLQRELAATQKAKAENDERFMRERDEARRERDQFLSEAKAECAERLAMVQQRDAAQTAARQAGEALREAHADAFLGQADGDGHDAENRSIPLKRLGKIERDLRKALSSLPASAPAETPTPEDSSVGLDDQPFCRDCADNDGICPNDGKVCGSGHAPPVAPSAPANTDSRIETRKHIQIVQGFLGRVIADLHERQRVHDQSKLVSPEVEVFDAMTPKLAASTYGSEEYKGFLAQMKPALDHHYAHNSHHPEHFADGIHGMSLLDVLEMLCDWKAATLRHNDGDIRKSIELNQKRFGYSDELKQILLNTLGVIEQPLSPQPLESAPSPMEAHAANAMTASGEAERRVVDDVDGKWTVSNDGERFWDTFETREEAVAEIAESGGWVGICDSIKPGDYAKGHADRIIEEIGTRLSEEVGDVADQQPIYTDADEKRLDEEIASVVERWMVGRVTCHRVLKVEEVPAQPTPALSDTEKQAMLQRLMVKYDAMRQAKKPTPAPSQDAEQTPVKGVDRG